MILVCTLGLSWQVIPEAYALLAPEKCSLYRDQPRSSPLFTPALPEPSEVWVVTTAGSDAKPVELWWEKLGRPVPLRWFRAVAVDGNAQGEVELIRELILRVVLAAGPDAVLCLSGGRKTMSADMQRAGTVFGCRAMVHVLAPDGSNQRLKAHDFTTPLPADIRIQAVVVGDGRRSDLLAIAPAITPMAYSVTEGDFIQPEALLRKAVEIRERDGGQMLANFHADLARDETHENWRSLYRLPPADIAKLRAEKIDPKHRDWLKALPKADLHCHIGGILDLDEQIAVGQAVWKTVSGHARDLATSDARAWLLANGKAGGDRWGFDDKHRRTNAAACLLAETDRAVLAEVLWTVTEPRVGLKKSHRWEFKAYEHPGSLVGSTILQSETATMAYAAAIKKRCQRDGIAYLEVRCSPQKYYANFLDDLYRSFAEDKNPDAPAIRVIVIADRRQGDTIAEVVRLALDARKRLGSFVVGLDLAGDEQRGDLQDIAASFHEAFAACLRITIHAGEGEPAANIWKSAYHLHADRIGHGLTLAESGSSELAARFRDRRICLELCPTSNREVVGYHDPDHRGAEARYPLRQLMTLGVPLTLCTDNPGISRTTLADEYLAAARMTDDGLSKWEALALMKQGFLHAFLPASERERLIKDMDQRIFNFIQGDNT